MLPERPSSINEEDMDLEETMAFEEEPEDFEQTTPRPPDVQNIRLQHPVTHTSSAPASAVPSRPITTRSGSTATVRMQRRVRLADKLREVFELDCIEEVWAGKPEPLVVLFRH
jgi:sterol 3beta-glucosyltransferase